jgi:hypothetical protein
VPNPKPKEQSFLFSGLLPVIILLAFLANAVAQEAPAPAGTNAPASAIAATNAPATNGPASITPPQETNSLESTTATNTAAVTNAPPEADTNKVVSPYQLPSLVTNQPVPVGVGLSQPVATFGVPPIVGPAPIGFTPPNGAFSGTSVVYKPPSLNSSGFPPLIHYGPVDVHAGVSYGVSQAYGVETQPGQLATTTIQSFGGSVSATLGKLWSLSYSPSYTVYSTPGLKNALDESLSFSGGTSYEDWTFGLGQSYAWSDDPLVETGTQTTQASYGTSLSAGVALGGKVGLSFSLSQSINDADQYVDVYSWGGGVSANYQFSRQLTIGLGVTGGYTLVSAGSSMPYEGVSGSINFQPRQKLSLALTAGIEDSQFVHPSAPSLLTPVFGASIGYQLFRGSSIALSASRSISPSYYANEEIVTTSIGISYSQELTKKISLSVSVGYVTEPYTTIVPATGQTPISLTPPQAASLLKNDNISTSYSIVLSYAVFSKISVSAFYSISDYSTGVSGSGFYSHQAGLSTSYAF